MKTPVLVGILIGVLILGVTLLAPWIRTGDALAVAAAREQAALAQRLLYRYDPRLAQVGRQAEPGPLQAANYDDLPPHVRQALEEANREYAQLLAGMAGRAQAEGLSKPDVRLPTPDGAGVRSAVERYAALLKENAQRLNDAAQNAKAARGSTGGGAVGVSQIGGTVEYARAAELLADAQQLRREQQTVQARLLLLAAQWHACRSGQDYEAGRETTPIRTSLRNDAQDTTTRHEEAAREVAALEAEVAQREAELTRVRGELSAGREALLALERQGFPLGNEEAFAAYRQQYLDLAQQLRALQEEEQILTDGGRRGAEFQGEDLETAPLVGGQEVLGLAELRHRLELARERARRLSAAVATIEDFLGFLEQTDNSARQGREHYAGLLKQLEAAQDQLKPELERLGREAFERENQALAAAREAASAFAASQQAADKWVGEARQVQTERDQQRRNPRLQKIVGDPALPQFGATGQALALTLSGRICAQRIAANQALLNDVKRFGELCPRPEFQLDPQPFEDQITTARDSGIDTLRKAEDLYLKVINRADAAKKWVAQANLAAVYHVWADVTPAESTALLGKALAALEEACRGREKSPYLAGHVQFRDHLRRLLGVTPAETPAEPQKPTAEQPVAEKPAEKPGEEKPAEEGTAIRP